MTGHERSRPEKFFEELCKQIIWVVSRSPLVEIHIEPNTSRTYKAGYTATPVACGRAGAVYEVFEQTCPAGVVKEQVQYMLTVDLDLTRGWLGF